MNHRILKQMLRCVVFIACLLSGAAAGTAADRPNVLFIAVDDLRPELGCYGESHMITPHLDRFAASGRLFQRHYVQVPTCGASRHALLTGRRPTKPSHESNEAVRQELAIGNPNRPVAFPQLFRENGYRTVCIGKISHYPDGHIYSYDLKGDGQLEMPLNWDEVGLPAGKWEHGWPAFFGYADGTGRVRGQSPPFESADVEDTGYPDGLIAEDAIAKLKRLKAGDKPFLLAVGFFKPHLPFCAPRKYFDLYDLDEIELSENPGKPANIAPQSYHGSGEMFGNYKHSGNRNDPAYQRQLRRAYYACVSYADAQVGKVLTALEALELDQNTIVVVWGDHGWHLGDHAIWGKHTNFERALRSALIVRIPDMPSPGTPAEGIVETVDLYPTLSELCGLSPPDDQLKGISFVPILRAPKNPGKTSAFGYFKRGRTMRTDRYRLTIYPANNQRAEFIELYDHQSDPLETTNVAGTNPEVVQRLRDDWEQQSPTYQTR